MTSRLSQIIDETRDTLPQLRSKMAELRADAERSVAAPEWDAAFGGTKVSVIAEVKRRSPSVGTINEGLDPVRLAQAYEAGGAAAVSVLTNEIHFGGCLDDLVRVGGSVSIPVLRKDFIVDPIQVYESRAAGASAVLLIVRALSVAELTDLAQLTRELGMQALVEVHDRAELDAAVRLEGIAVGVNSRNLETFEVDLACVQDIIGLVPGNMNAIAESGLARRNDVVRVAEWGADGVLVGTALAGSSDPVLAVESMAGVERHGRN